MTNKKMTDSSNHNAEIGKRRSLYPPCSKSGWPDNFDFESDETCQTLFKPYIEKVLQKLEEYDARRPQDTAYIFHQHAKRVADDVKETCLYLGLGEKVANNMYWALLIHDLGKVHLPVDIWDIPEKPQDDIKARRRTHTELGADEFENKFSGIDHPFKNLALNIIHFHHEQMDGNGPYKIPGEKLPPAVKLASIVEAFDGWSTPRPHFNGRDVSPPAVLVRMNTEKAHMFDPMLLHAFSKVKCEEPCPALIPAPEPCI